MKSMTGYGKGTVSINGRNITIELKSVNNRYLEVNSRIPKNMMVCDEIIRRCIQSRIKRGTIDVFFSYENNSENSYSVNFNYDLAQKLIGLAAEMNQTLGIQNDFHCSALMRTPDIICIEELKDDEEVFAEIAAACIEKAVDSLEKMRQNEGMSIKKDLCAPIELLMAGAAAITARAPDLVEEYRQKIYSRMKEILKSVEVDEAKLLNEVAFFADKVDINEELSRLSSHFTQFKECLESDESVGRKLDFISQEIGREINTIGSKSNDLSISNVVLDMKNNLEKIREQIRNVE